MTSTKRKGTVSKPVRTGAKERTRETGADPIRLAIEGLPLSGICATVLGDLLRRGVEAEMAAKHADRRRPRRIVPISPLNQTLTGRLRQRTEHLVPKDVARLLRIHEETARERLKQGRLPGHKDGSRWKTDPGDLADWLEEQMAGGRP